MKRGPDVTSRKDLLTFIEARGFTDAWARLKLGVEALLELQLAILRNAKAGDVIQGTGGLRKLRFAPSRWRTGKSGALRVLYVYFEEFGIVLLTFVYSKKETADFSAAQKRSIREFIERERKIFARRAGK